MLARLTFIAALAAAPMAMAQDAPKEAPATAEEVAAARAIADRLIAEADAEGIFVNSTDSGLAEVTHVASGMTCMFDGGQYDRIAIFPVSDPKIPRGYDVGCVSYDEALKIDLSLYATRYRPLPSERAVLDSARGAIENRWPDARPYTGDFMTVEGQTPPLAAAYRVRIDGEDMLTLALVTHRDEWGFKARATGPYKEAMGVSLYAGVMLTGALLERDTD
ncbi:hypothetical protein GGR12_001099 [Brevundimonas lenta]|uniref:Uncharacterized protein n=2 Tax=Brevundimonas lenta TaxID=424796 RepID=A0A7W6NNE1_9CAUL|nr:hypothetical protein [Brevundimonas lenta]MBB4082260.1 hypothetical protein [Brevundimonas lenta]